MSPFILAFLDLGSIGKTSGPGHGAAFLVLLAFTLSFLFIRTSARMNRAEVSWWPGSVETSSGLHLHHLVWGISLMLFSGFVGFALITPSEPWYALASIGFGIGAGLTFDEFALWIHLDDVYWSDEGRQSLDAVVLVAAFMALVVIGERPFGLSGENSRNFVAAWIVVVLVFSVCSFLKGRIALGLIGIFIPAFGIWASCRLANPTSPWASRFYNPAKLDRARARYPVDRRGKRMLNGFLNAIGGRPTGD